MLEVQDIHVGYGQVKVLYGVSLEANAGEILCLVGRNGAGKTTAMKSIMGLLPLSSGSVVLDGETISTHCRHMRYRESASVTFRRGVAPVPRTHRCGKHRKWVS